MENNKTSVTINMFNLTFSKRTNLTTRQQQITADLRAWRVAGGKV